MCLDRRILCPALVVLSLTACGGEGNEGAVMTSEPELQSSVEARDQALNCTAFENPDKPPVLLVHGTDDEVVPFQFQAASRDMLQARSIEVETVDCVGLGHGIDPDGLSAAIEFLAKYLPT